MHKYVFQFTSKTTLDINIQANFLPLHIKSSLRSHFGMPQLYHELPNTSRSCGICHPSGSHFDALSVLLGY